MAPGCGERRCLWVCVRPLCVCDTWEDSFVLSCEKKCVWLRTRTAAGRRRGRKGASAPPLHLCLRRGAVYSELWLIEF